MASASSTFLEPDAISAILLDGKAHFVDGSHLDDHGDAHAPEGLCNAVRPAIVSGRLTDGRFQAERFEVVPAGGS